MKPGKIICLTGYSRETGNGSGVGYVARARTDLGGPGGQGPGVSDWHRPRRRINHLDIGIAGPGEG